MNRKHLIYLPLLSAAAWVTMLSIKQVSLMAGDLAGLVYHLSLIPLVAILPGSPAARFAGYLWLYMDALVDMVSINNIGEANVWALRMGVHLFASIWICRVSWGLRGLSMWIGLPLGVGLAFHAIFLSDVPHSKMILGYPVLPMMAAWLISLFFVLRKNVALHGDPAPQLNAG